MKNLIIIWILLIATPFLYAQKIDFYSVNSNNVLSILENQVKQSPNIKSETAYNKVTKIVQIGNSNTTEVYNRSEKSNLLMSQIGDYNTTLFVNPYANQKTDQEVNVKGSNNYIDITGSNSVSQGIIINLSQSDKMVFIRNY